MKTCFFFLSPGCGPQEENDIVPMVEAGRPVGTIEFHYEVPPLEIGRLGI